MSVRFRTIGAPLPAPRIATWLYEWVTQVWVIAGTRAISCRGSSTRARERARWARNRFFTAGEKIAFAQSPTSFPQFYAHTQSYLHVQREIFGDFVHHSFSKAGWSVLDVIRLNICGPHTVHDSEFKRVLNGINNKYIALGDIKIEESIRYVSSSAG